MLNLRLATLLALLLVAVGGIGILWSILSTITNPPYPVTVLIGLGLFAAVVAKGFTDATITSTAVLVALFRAPLPTRRG